jgi:hypothetical protein
LSTKKIIDIAAPKYIAQRTPIAEVYLKAFTDLASEIGKTIKN